MLEGYNTFDRYIETVPLSTSAASSTANSVEVGHGDWVLEAFFQQIDDPNCVEVIAIDCDGLCPGNSQSDFSYLFSGGGSVFELLVTDAITRTMGVGDIPVLMGLSASFTTTSPDAAVAVDGLINEQNAFVIQSAPNVSSAGVPWGDFIPLANVINVGSWNTPDVQK